MPAVTQLIPNYIGGVSRQPDAKKLPGQVREIDNGYCDPTFGLTKRNGFQYLATAGSYTSDEDELKNASWFFINRDARELYFGCITTDKQIKIWNALDRNTPVTVEYEEEKDSEGNVTYDARDYLEVPDPVFPQTEKQAHGNFDTLTVRAQTFIVNKTITVEEDSSEVYPLKERATIKLMELVTNVPYDVTITIGDGDPVPCTFTQPIPEESDPPPTADDYLEGIKADIETNLPDLIVTKFATSLEIESPGVPFSIDVKGGVTGAALEVYQDTVGNSSRLAATTKDGRRVRIQNTTDEKSYYFVKFVANDAETDGGTGYWEENLGWSEDDEGVNLLASAGLVNATMPHALKNTDVNTFKFERIKYTERLVGSEQSNAAPSFVNEKISSIFIYSNRLGFLSTENVILSAAADFENFYFVSAQTIIDSDPIDLNCSSIRPANLFAAIPQTQGIILFSQNEQFNLFSDGQFLTPLDATLRSISNYEATPTVMPVDIGTSIIFTSKTPSYTKTLAMTTRGQDNSPIVVDISKVAADYVPSSITDLTASSQNSFISLSSQSNNLVYIYRFFNNGQQDIMQAWFRWLTPGSTQTLVIANDQVFTVCKTGSEYVILGASLAQAADAGMNGRLKEVNPRIDMFFSPMEYPDTPITYDASTNLSTIPTPYTKQVIGTPIVVQVPPMGTRTPGGTIFDIPLTYQQGPDAGKPFAEDTGYLPEVVATTDGNWAIKGDWTDKANRLLVGYRYSFVVDLPTTFFRTQGVSDYTAVLTISRYKFSFGDTGIVEFRSSAFGSDTWNKVEPVPSANYYGADNAPFTNENLITVPIYQKNQHFKFQIRSSTPAPVTLNSMMWEGQYSPRYYRRAG